MHATVYHNKGYKNFKFSYHTSLVLRRGENYFSYVSHVGSGRQTVYGDRVTAILDNMTSPFL